VKQLSVLSRWFWLIKYNNKVGTFVKDIHVYAWIRLQAHLKAGPLNRPGTISIMSWPNTIPIAFFAGIRLTDFPLSLDQQFSLKGQLS
jgi:hypothetical protein